MELALLFQPFAFFQIVVFSRMLEIHAFCTAMDLVYAKFLSVIHWEMNL